MSIAETLPYLAFLGIGLVASVALVKIRRARGSRKKHTKFSLISFEQKEGEDIDVSTK